MRFTHRQLATGATLAGLSLLLVVMAVWGYHAATAPFEDAGPALSGPSCSPEEQTVQRYLHRRDITVSVFNAGGRKGLAQSTMDRLEHAGFRPGEVGNAKTAVEYAVVHTTRSNDQAAELVAQMLGGDARVEQTEENYGPGVDVFVGQGFKRLDRSTPRRVKLDQPIVTCIPVGQ